MKQFVKTIFLILFITLFTIGHAIADNGFTNSIVELRVLKWGKNNAAISIGVENYYNAGEFRMTGENTYVLNLPGIDCKATPQNGAPDIVSSIDVVTRKYNGSNEGYTKITVRAKNPIKLSTSTHVGKIFAASNANDNKQESNAPKPVVNSPPVQKTTTNNTNNQYRTSNAQTSGSTQRQTTSNSVTRQASKPESTAKPPSAAENPGQNNKTEASVPKFEDEQNSPELDKLLVILGVFLVILISIFSYLKAKDKLIEISGERVKIDVNDDEEAAQKKKKTIKNTINTLDKKYSKPVRIPVASEYVQPAPTMSEEKSTDEMNIVDLDELYKAGNQQEQNDALEDFLASYGIESASNEIHQEKDEDLYKIDEELFNRVINSKNIRFTPEDMECINKILNIEISDDAIENIEKYLPKTPVKKSKKQILENLVSNYSISQNITFTDKDVKALDDLANVELDKDFVTDLRTDPNRTKEMENEIRRHFEEDMKKPSEVITLKVADLLPDLKDVEANPEKYAEPEQEKVIVDVDALLKGIENVTFKPFDDGSQNFEVLNNFDDEDSKNVIELYSDIPDITNTEIVSEKGPSEVKLPEKNQKKTIQQRGEAAGEIPKRAETTTKCHMDGRMYDIISSVKFTEKAGCYLVKDDDGYTVLSYYRNKVSLLKKYKDLKSEKIQARLSEKINNTLRYIVRIGNKKFIADFDGSCINFVMDL